MTSQQRNCVGSLQHSIDVDNTSYEGSTRPCVWVRCCRLFFESSAQRSLFVMCKSICRPAAVAQLGDAAISLRSCLDSFEFLRLAALATCVRRCTLRRVCTWMLTALVFAFFAFNFPHNYRSPVAVLHFQRWRVLGLAVIFLHIFEFAICPPPSFGLSLLSENTVYSFGPCLPRPQPTPLLLKQSCAFWLSSKLQTRCLVVWQCHRRRRPCPTWSLARGAAGTASQPRAGVGAPLAEHSRRTVVGHQLYGFSGRWAHCQSLGCPPCPPPPPLPSLS